MENQFEKAEFFDTPEQLAASMQADNQQEAAPVEQAQAVEPQAPVQQNPMRETPYVDPNAAPSQPQTVADVQTQQQPQEDVYSDDDIEDAVLTFLSERLGREINSFDDIVSSQPAIDERVQAIANFVSETGRRPEDWFTYQSMNTSEMDDLVAVRVQYSQRYPNLSFDEINRLVGGKYKLNPDIYDDEDIQMSMLQLKIDAADAKKEIEVIRQKFAAPIQEEAAAAAKPRFDDNWFRNMTSETEALQGLEFNLGGDKTFTYSINDEYKRQLISKNSNLESFFDSYVDRNGKWDYDKLNSHLAVIDNIDSIVSSAYRQGLGDGQRTVVSNAANISTNTTPQGGQNNQENPLASQVRELLRGGSSKLTFNV